MAGAPLAADACAAFIKYNLEAWPLVRAVVQPNVTPTDEQFDAHLQCFHDLLCMDKPFFVEFDVRHAQGASLSQLRRQARQMVLMKQVIKRNLVCSSIVVDSRSLQLLLGALFALQKPTKPNEVFKTSHEAEQWMRNEWDKVMEQKFFFE